MIRFSARPNLCIAMICSVCLSCAGDGPSQQIDLVLANAKIWTGNPEQP